MFFDTSDRCILENRFLVPENLPIYRISDISESNKAKYICIASRMNERCHVQHKMGKHADALRNSEKALKIRLWQLGGDSPDTAASLASVGVILHVMGRHAEALERKEQALAIRRRELGESAPDTAQSLNSVGVTLHSMGCYPEALARKQEALASRRR